MAQSSTKQIPDLVKSKGILSPKHKANVGKIKFTSAGISSFTFEGESYKDESFEIQEKDFLESFEISEKNTLYLNAFFDNSLTNYLHQLNPELNADELLKKGNFQFSFFLDDQLLYTENLNNGAGLPFQKNRNTILSVPLMNSGQGWWGEYLWQRFYYRNGSEKILSEGTHLLRIEIRPYLDHKKLLVGKLLAQGELNIKMAEPEKVPEEQIAIQPIQPNSGWTVSTDHYDKEKIRALNEKIAQHRFKKITSIVAIKNGKLLIEEYFNEATRNSLHDVRSVGKSFASTIMGIAIQEGHIKSIDQTIDEFYDLKEFANYSTKKSQVTLKSLLTMSSAFDGSDQDWNSPGHEEKMYPTDDWVKFTLDLDMDKTKEIGKTWDYFTAGVIVLGDILDKSVPQGLEKYADQKLFQPLGITQYKWPYTPQNVPSTAGGIRLRALDFAKYGQLYQNKGDWNGKQILSTNWVKQTMTNYFPISTDNFGYGFLFWNKTFFVDDKPYEAFFCSGNGGNKIIVFKDLNLTLVITAKAYNQPYAHSQVEKMLQDYLLPAILD